jgi:orotate phosphoribosyltransferase
MTKIVLALLQDIRQLKFREEIDLVREYMKIDEKEESYVFECNLESEPEVIDSLDTVPTLVTNYVKQVMRPYQFGTKKLEQKEKIREIQDTDAMQQLKYQTQTFFLTGKGVITGHFSLNTGWHTDKYVKCRKLCSDYAFVAELCQELAEIYQQLNFTDILAVGTSALGIGGLLSFLLGTRFHYTFGDIRITPASKKKRDYTDYEIDVVLSNNGRILIIDDILAKGDVLAAILAKLEKTSPPDYLRLFCIYALGDLSDAAKEIKEIDVDYVASFPDVKYYRGDPDGFCELCRDSAIRAVPE